MVSVAGKPLACSAAGPRARERVTKFKEGRLRAENEIRQAKRSGVVAGFTLLVSADDCAVCQAVQGKVFPVGRCTAEDLPPYENCELEGGCRATFTAVLKPEYGGPLVKRPRRWWNPFG